jgi:hypothetical protein
LVLAGTIHIDNFAALQNKFALLVLLALFVCRFLQIKSKGFHNFKANAALRKKLLLTYRHPTQLMHFVQRMSATTCIPVVIRRSSRGPLKTLLTLLNRYALPFLE